VKEILMRELLEKLLPSFILKRIQGRLYVQKILENMSWLFFDKLFRMGVGLFVGVWVARYLGPDGYGTLGYAQAFVALFSAFASLGLDSIVIRDIVNEPGCRDETLGTAYTLRLFGGVFTTIICLSVIYFLRPGDTLTFYLVGIIAVGTVFQSFHVIDFWFSSQVESKYTVYAQSIAFIIISIVKIILILNKAPLMTFAWAALAEIIIGSIGLIIFYQINGYSIFKWRISWSRAKELLNQSWPLILSGLAIMIYMKIDQVMLGQMLGDFSVGIYTVAVKVSEIWYFIPTAIVASVTPAIYDAKKISETLYYQRLQKLFNILAVIAYGVALTMTFLSGWLINLLFGTEYISAGPVLAIHIWAAVFVFIGVARGVFLISEGLMKFSFVTTVIGAIVNIATNYLLIPAYGSIGAAVATLVAYAVSAYFCGFFYNKTYRITIMITYSLYLRGLR
jgi:PST family polysaccharide transporter